MYDHVLVLVHAIRDVTPQMHRHFTISMVLIQFALSKWNDGYTFDVTVQPHNILSVPSHMGVDHNLADR